MAKKKTANAATDSTEESIPPPALAPIPASFQPRAHEEAELTPEQLDILYQKLMEERQRVIDGFRRHVDEVIQDGDQYADELDLSARNSEQAYLLRFADKERKLLDEIDHALQKMAGGEYGVCEGTGDPISFRRLELRPWTRYSVAFKEQLERWKVD